MRMAKAIGDPSRAGAYVKAKRKAREPIMGFGHRVYRAEDPRARHMREGVKRLSEEMGQPHWYEILEALVEAMRPYSRHGVNVNVDFYAGVVYYLHGIRRICSCRSSRSDGSRAGRCRRWSSSRTTSDPAASPVHRPRCAGVRADRRTRPEPRPETPSRREPGHALSRWRGGGSACRAIRGCVGPRSRGDGRPARLRRSGDPPDLHGNRRAPRPGCRSHRQRESPPRPDPDVPGATSERHRSA